MSMWKSIIKHWDNILKTDRKAIIRNLRIGIPDKYRKIVWALLTEAETTKAKSSFTYESMRKKRSDSEGIIDCDVPRTFPRNPKFGKSKRRSLRNVLVAYSNADQELGYIQGMNFIAGMFVLYQDEETSFWSFYSLMQRSHRMFYINDFIHVREMSPVIDQLLSERMPDVYRVFKEKEIIPLIYTPNWFNSCFMSAELDDELTLFIFDEFLAFGDVILLSFGITIISLFKDILFNKDIADFLAVLTCPGRADIMHCRHTVNMEWVRQWITNKEYKRYTKIYKDNPELVAQFLGKSK